MYIAGTPPASSASPSLSPLDFVVPGISMASNLLGMGMEGHFANKNLQFQREMAKNKYRWAVKDMRAAGLNPILAATKGVSAGGPAGTAIPRSRDLGIMQSAIAYHSARKIKGEADMLATQERLMREQAAGTYAKTKLTEKQVQQIDKSMDHVTQQISESQTRVQNLIKQGHILSYQAEVNKNKAELIRMIENGVGPFAGLTPEVAKIVSKAASVGFDVLVKYLMKGAK